LPGESRLSIRRSPVCGPLVEPSSHVRASDSTSADICTYTAQPRGAGPDSDIVTGNDSINGNWSYSYDDFNRLSGSNKNSGSQTFSYAYDRYSNRWQQNAPQGGPAPQYSFNGNNQITASGVVYDAAGNVTNDGLGNTYTYDAENRLISMSGTNAASYVYDAFGQRVRTTVNSSPYDFINAGGRAVDEVTASSWVWGDAGGLQVAAYANSTTYFSHNDWLGSVRGWSNVSGSSVGTCTSLAFGDGMSCSGTTPVPVHYGDQLLDSESNMHHYLYRQLSTTQGRWSTTDPAGLGAADTGNPQSWNRYTFVENGPTMYIDPLGLKRPSPGDVDIYTLIGLGLEGGGLQFGALWNPFDLFVFPEIEDCATCKLGVPGASDFLFAFLFGPSNSCAGPNPPSPCAPAANDAITTTFRLITKSDFCRGGDRTIRYQLVNTSTGGVPSSNWWVTEHIQAPVPTNSGGTNETPNQYLDWLSNGGTPYNALQSFTVSQGSGAPSYPVYVNIGGQDYGTLGLWMSNNPLRNGQPSPNSVNCPPQ
jgi:RHS repeat-associated protein